MSEVLRFLPFHVHAHKSSACNAWTMSAALRLIRRMLSLRITLAAFVLFIPTSQCLTSNGTVCTQALLCDILCMLDLHSWYVCVMTGSAIPFCCLFVVLEIINERNWFTTGWESKLLFEVKPFCKLWLWLWVCVSISQTLRWMLWVWAKQRTETTTTTDPRISRMLLVQPLMKSYWTFLYFLFSYFVLPTPLHIWFRLILHLISFYVHYLFALITQFVCRIFPVWGNLNPVCELTFLCFSSLFVSAHSLLHAVASIYYCVCYVWGSCIHLVKETIQSMI